jgi:hypothetical protein
MDGLYHVSNLVCIRDAAEPSPFEKINCVLLFSDRERSGLVGSRVDVRVGQGRGNGSAHDRGDSLADALAWGVGRGLLHAIAARRRRDW